MIPPPGLQQRSESLGRDHLIDRLVGSIYKEQLEVWLPAHEPKVAAWLLPFHSLLRVPPFMLRACRRVQNHPIFCNFLLIRAVGLAHSEFGDV